MATTIRKAQLEASLHNEKKLIEDGRLKDENPLDMSENFSALCEACRRGDLKTCQEIIVDGVGGVNINARDRFDYTPLILASLCGHYEVVQYLLQSGALCKRDTFQGERCLYNALNNRIRKLLLSYDYHKSADPLQPFASHITSLITREVPKTSDIVVKLGNDDESFQLHKFILAARCPYFSTTLSESPEIKSWDTPWTTIPSPAISIAMRYIYLDDVPSEVGGGPGTGFSEGEILKGVSEISKQLGIPSLQESLLEKSDPRLAGQLKREEVQKGQQQFFSWFRENVLGNKILIDSAEADDLKWDFNNGVFADVLLRADESEDEEDAIFADESADAAATVLTNSPNDNQTKFPPRPSNGVLPTSNSHPSQSSSQNRPSKKSTLYPVHRSILIRSDFFLRMFSSPFREAQPSAFLPIIPLDCKPAVLEIVLTFLYSEKSDFPLDHAIDVLYAADLLLIEKLKVRAAVVISTLGNGSMRSGAERRRPAAAAAQQQQEEVEDKEEEQDHEVINIYDVLRAGWLTRVPRLEEFAARYFAYRLETYIEEEEFAEVIRESAGKIRGRQETDSIVLVDEIRYYLSERFRLRFEDAGLTNLLQLPHSASAPASAPTSTSSHPLDTVPPPPGEKAEKEQERGRDEKDEFSRSATSYETLLGRIDALLVELGLDA